MMKKKEKSSVTIQTVAKLANVSHTTVSRALNGSSLVKPQTRQKIEEIAESVGYVPNYNARRLVTHRSYNIGIFFSNLDQGTSFSFLANTIEKMEETLSPKYTFSIGSVENAATVGKMSQQNYDGILIMSQSDKDNDFIEAIHRENIPLVVLNRNLVASDINNFAFDDELGEQLATEYAIRMGHRKFALIKGIESFESAKQRTIGFQKALKNYGIFSEKVIYGQGNYRPESGNHEMRRILSSVNVPTCVICENDDMAIGAINACIDMGYRVPEDISVIGFDDMSYSKYLIPELTTVRKPTSELIKKGVERLFKLIQDEDQTIVKEVLPPEIIIRSSVAQLNTAQK